MAVQFLNSEQKINDPEAFEPEIVRLHRNQK